MRSTLLRERWRSTVRFWCWDYDRGFRIGKPYFIPALMLLLIFNAFFRDSRSKVFFMVSSSSSFVTKQKLCQSNVFQGPLVQP